MIPQTETAARLLEFVGALSVLSGAMSWWRRGSDEEDKVVADAADLVLDSIADADNVTTINGATGLNLRDQISIEEAIEMDRERSLRRWPFRN